MNKYVVSNKDILLFVEWAKTIDAESFRDQVLSGLKEAQPIEMVELINQITLCFLRRTLQREEQKYRSLARQLVE